MRFLFTLRPSPQVVTLFTLIWYKRPKVLARQYLTSYAVLSFRLGSLIVAGSGERSRKKALLAHRDHAQSSRECL